MNIDMSIHRMAFRETDSLVLAQVLVAKKRGELELRELREQVVKGSDSAGANLDSSLRYLEDGSEALRRAAEQRAQAQAQREDAAAEPQHVDKTA